MDRPPGLWREPSSGTFKYEYDTNRYFWEQFTATMLQDLIDAKKFNVEIQVTKKGSTESVTKTLTEEEVIASLSAADNGIINFSYAFTDADTTWDQYDGATFQVSVWTAANGTDHPVYTITTTLISDPSAYVKIPKYVILEDGNTNLDENEYAGKEVVVTYKGSSDTTTRAAYTPEITVKVQSDVPLHEGSVNGTEMSQMTIGIYSQDGTKLDPPEGEDYSTIGTLSASQDTLPFWMNVRRGTEKNKQYYAEVMFQFAMNGTIT